jgi:hypothetical protein
VPACSNVNQAVAKNIILFLGVIVYFSLIDRHTRRRLTVKDDVYGGVRVGDIDVGGLTLAAAEKKITPPF